MPTSVSPSRAILHHQSLLWLMGLLFTLAFNGIAPWALALTIGTILLVIGAVLWQGYAVHPLTLPRGSLLWAIFLYWVWLGLTTLWNPVPYLGSMSFWWMGMPGLITLTLALQGGEQVEKLWEKMEFLLLLVALGLCVAVLYDLYLHGKEPLGPFLYRNSLASFLAVLLLPMLGRVMGLVQQGRVSEGLFPVLIALLMLHLIFIIHSLGVYLSLGVGVLILAWGGKRWVGWRPVAALAGILLAGWLFHLGLDALLPPAWSAPEKLGRVLRVLNDPTLVQNPAWQEQSQRVLLLQGGWKLLQDAPWYGIGLGTLWLVWPPYQHPMDLSSGFYLHCDPLQIAIEAGIPGILLLAWIAVALVGRFARMQWRGREKHPGAGMSGVAMMAALAAVGVHAGIDFDLYVLPILYLVGIYLARFAWLSGEEAVVLPVSRLTTWGRYAVFTVLMVGIGLAHALALLASDLMYGYGTRLAIRGDLRWADTLLEWSTRLFPNQDNVRFAHASLFIALTEREKDPALRKVFFQTALESIEAALERNPYRWGSYFMRGTFLRQYPDLAGVEGVARMEDDFRQALRLNPRYVMARVMLAKVLWERGNQASSQEVLREGLNHVYPPWLIKADDSRVYYELLLERVPDPDGGVARQVKEATAMFGLPMPVKGGEQAPVLPRVDFKGVDLPMEEHEVPSSGTTPSW